MSTILFVLPTDALGGAESTLKKLCRYFLGRGYNLDVIFLAGPDTASWHDLKQFPTLNLIHLKAKRELFGFPNCLKYFFLKRLKGMHKYDFSFTSHTHCNAFISMCVYLNLLSISNVVLRESTNVFSWFRGVKLKLIHALYFLYSRKSLVICQTHKMRLDFIDNVKWIKPKNVVVFENPVEFDMLEKLSLQPCVDKVDILAVGRLVSEKAYDILLHSFSLVLHKYPDKKLTIIGSGKEFDSILSTIKKLNLQDSVFLKGSLSNPYNYMKNSSVSVLSSRLEGFPNVLFEMMSLSSSVVSTICADGIESLPGIYTAPTESSENLAKAIIRAIEEDDTTKGNNVLSMRAKVKSLTVEKYVENIYESLSKV
jgi:glycosyltransferase involved in cell wall biosynthesis